MRIHAAFALPLCLLLLSPHVVAAFESSIAARSECSAFLPGQPCVVAQEGTLAVVCAGSCDLVVVGNASAADAFPVKEVTTSMRIASSMATVTSGCVGAGLGTTTCDVEMRFPFVTSPGECDSITVSTRYARGLQSYGVGRAFSVCQEADGEIAILTG